MKMYKEYLKERENKMLYQNDKGFLTYSFEVLENEKVIYIQDIFISKEFRKHNCASEMADYVINKEKQNGITKVLGSVDISANNSDISMRVLLGYGMRPYSISGNVVYFVKGL